LSSLIDLIDELVTVCGSSIAQEKHIGLLKKEATILEKKVAELTIERAVLINRMRALEAKSQNTLPSINNNQSIQKIYQHFRQEPPAYFPLNEREIEILVTVSMKQEIGLKEISVSLNILEQIVGYYLKELETQDMVIHLLVTSDEGSWSLSSKGRQYLLDNGIVT